MDFSATGTTIADDKLFAGTDASSTLLPPIRLTGKTATVAVERNLLPADLHYSPVDLVKLFMKPTLEVGH